MSIYALHKVCQLVRKDPAFVEQLRSDPTGTLAAFRLTDEERTALLEGDVRRLLDMGVHGYVLTSLARNKLFGLDLDLYTQRAHTQAPQR